MAEICVRVGGSKATLYNHFSSKDELFFEVMSRLCEEEFSAVLKLVAGARRHYAGAESVWSALFALYLLSGCAIQPAADRRFLSLALENGLLHRADPRITALHLSALLQAELMDRIVSIPALVPRTF